MASTTTRSGNRRSRSKDTGVDYDRLCAAVNASYRALKPFRENRAKAVKEYAGNHYGERAAEQRVPLNLMSIFIQVMTRLLVAKLPRVLMGTFKKKMKKDVTAAQDWTNEKLEKMEFDETLERWVVDAFFSIGILKVALATPGDAVSENWGLESGEAFAEIVDLDDWVFDVKSARRFSQATYVGHRVLIPKDVLADDEQIDAKTRKKFRDPEKTYDDMVGSDRDERVHRLQQGDESTSEDEFEEFIECWEIYLPRRRLVCLFLASELEAIQGKPSEGQASCEPLKCVPWVGPPCGPYHILGFGAIPDNAMPKAPIQDLYDLHMGFNTLFRKAMRQAERMKVVFAVRGAADKDGSRIKDAPDGMMVMVDDPSGVVPMVWPGADAALVQFAMMLKDLFDFMAGNLTTLTGRAPAAPTATQEKILAAGSSAQVDDMALRVLRATVKAVRALFWYWWHDPFKTMTSELSIPGMPEVSTTRNVRPEDREQGSFSDINLRIDVYSMQPQTPQSRMQAIMGVVQQLYIPLAQLAEKQGVYMDLQVLFDLVAKYSDQPDLSDIFSIQTPPETAGEMGGSESGTAKPAATERTYNRVSSSERTSAGEANERTQLMGAAQQNGQPGSPY